ncbi:urease accessory protein UreE [Boseongicola aestuarii]|uniref:Urease accessory protein UreE n=1 Tax=Boseongicola aestuarii TaxID=1470561 RepID=A0A238J110_9RHOB|nr:urease accessory protein UreE [Boseongicola aestuarii]SMX24388.1 Urease accessory protein UreE 1 [Boseongicola aestuarii]
MTSLPLCQSIRPGAGSGATDRCHLTYEDRFLRRKVLTSDSGMQFLVDLEGATHLNDQDAFVLEDDRLIAITAAPEDLVQVTGHDLLRFAWHIGNRHTPCQVETARLLISRDHVIEAMLRQLGAELTLVNEPFLPEGGAYGHGRTFGHDHGPAHGHAKSHGHDHHHGHAHSHE